MSLYKLSSLPALYRKSDCIISYSSKLLVLASQSTQYLDQIGRISSAFILISLTSYLQSSCAGIGCGLKHPVEHSLSSIKHTTYRNIATIVAI